MPVVFIGRYSAGPLSLSALVGDPSSGVLFLSVGTRIRFVDPYTFFADPDPTTFYQDGSGLNFFLMRIRI